MNAIAVDRGWRNAYQWQEARKDPLYQQIIEKQMSVLRISYREARALDGPITRGIGAQMRDLKEQGLSDKEAMRLAIRDSARMLGVRTAPGGEYNWESHREFYGTTP